MAASINSFTDIHGRQMALMMELNYSAFVTHQVRPNCVGKHKPNRSNGATSNYAGIKYPRACTSGAPNYPCADEGQLITDSDGTSIL